MFKSSFLLFLILLSALVISMLFGNSWLLSRKEGFVSFGYTNPNIMNVTISKYSSAEVIYLYDNLYFDGKNGNLIEVDSAYCGNVKVNGATVNGNAYCHDESISQIWVTTSSSHTTNINVNTNANTGVNIANGSAIPQITQLVYLSNSQNISSPAGYRYEVFYVTWGLDTYLHLIGLDPNAPAGTHLKSFFYNSTGSMMRYIDFTSSTYIPSYKQTFSSNDDANNGTTYVDTTYSSTSSLYQISKYVKYDISAGYVVIGSPGAYLIYDRGTGAVVPSSSGTSTISSLSSFISWIVTDGNNGMVVVMGFAYQTVILILNADANNNYYNISFCARFTNVAMIKALDDATNVHVDGIHPRINDLPCVDELSCKWYYYFKTIGNNPDILFKNDYIRKTQVVPPVCPTCPNCPDVSGVCTSCGGTGGSGTTTEESTTSEVLETTEEAVGGAVGLAKEAVGGTVGLAKEVVGGTVGVARNVVGGVVGAARNVVGGVVGAARNVAGRIRNRQSDSGFGYVPGHGYTPVDNYSAYGASQSKGSNFMPVTASFSAFGK